jgi:DNA-binding LacI/PurR family transcriptional regulator
MNIPNRPPTIADVARQAGVSIATVSRVLNGNTPVIPETAERVEAAIRALSYVPRTAARVLASRRTNTIGLLLPEISGAFFSPLLRGIEAAAREAGFDLLIHSTDEPYRMPRARRPLGEHNTDGLLIFTDSLEDEEIARLHTLGLPLVLMHQSVEGYEIPTITIENKDGAARIVGHLIEVHGRRRIVFLRGPERHEDSVWRERGYCESLEAHGLPVDPALISLGGFDREIARASMQELIAQGADFDAVFCGDDDAALGVLTTLKEAGRQVPDEVAVVGFDDVPFAPFLSPPLTTVRAPIEQVGREAVKQLVHLIRGEQAEPLTLLPTEVIVRNSCGCK